MLHVNRTHRIVDVATAEELAEKLVGKTWSLCTGFRHEGMLFLNDATSEDGAQEYAVYHEARGQQIESITFSWMASAAKGLEVITEIKAGRDQQPLWTTSSKPKLDTMPTHKCGFCA